LTRQSFEPTISGGIASRQPRDDRRSGTPPDAAIEPTARSLTCQVSYLSGVKTVRPFVEKATLLSHGKSSPLALGKPPRFAAASPYPQTTVAVGGLTT
jgi:hypothetical protein